MESHTPGSASTFTILILSILDHWIIYVVERREDNTAKRLSRDRCICFNRSMDKVTLPSGSQSLTLSEEFNQSMDNVTLPICRA